MNKSNMYYIVNNPTCMYNKEITYYDEWYLWSTILESKMDVSNTCIHMNMLTCGHHTMNKGDCRSDSLVQGGYSPSSGLWQILQVLRCAEMYP